MLGISWHGIPWYLLGLVVLVAGTAFWYVRRKLVASARLQAQLHREFLALQQEKKVIYDFIHDLGEAFTEDIDREHLLRIIVTCARKVTGARGAAIYLWDADREKLVASMVSGVFPPVLKVDNIVADQLAAKPENLEAFLKLEAIPADSTTVIAEVAQSGKGIFAERTELDERFPWFSPEGAPDPHLHRRPAPLPAGAARRPGPGQPRRGQGLQPGRL
ncbi:MAG: hypothetical protein WDO13_13610 [Verrucomicrobiota bacterium]